MNQLDSMPLDKLNALIFTICLVGFMIVVLLLLMKETIALIANLLKEAKNKKIVSVKTELDNRRAKNMAVVKRELLFVTCETDEDEIKIGEPVILRLQNGDRIKTSPVENWEHNFGREFKIITRNTVYRRYFN
jgi:hypothetical protein